MALDLIFTQEEGRIERVEIRVVAQIKGKRKMGER